jgi:hypothetical protein
MQTVCGGGVDLCWRPYSAGVLHDVSPDSEPTKLSYHHPKQNLGGEGTQTDKRLPQSPFSGQFFGIAFYQSNLSAVQRLGVKQKSTFAFRK